MNVLYRNGRFQEDLLRLRVNPVYISVRSRAQIFLTLNTHVFPSP